MTESGIDSMVDNILSVYRSASAEQSAQGSQWYAMAHDTAERLAQAYGTRLEVAAGVIAATSPTNSWGANVKLAERILATGDTSRGYLKVMLAKVRAILDSPEGDPLDILTSLKVSNFYRGIISRGTDGLTVDRHAYDIAVNRRHADSAQGATADKPERPRIAGRRYANVSAAYVHAAEILSAESGRQISACEIQGVTWIVWRNRFWADGAFDGRGE